LIDEALASRPAQMKNEPAQNLEMKDFSLAVGMMPLILWRVFGTARWRPVFRLHQLRTMRKKSCLSGEALWYQQASLRQAPMTHAKVWGAAKHSGTMKTRR
jgi:hypothetical protein